MEFVKGINGGGVVEVREMVLVEVTVVDPSLQELQGTITVFTWVNVLQVEVTVVTPPTHVVHGTVIVVRKGVVGTGDVAGLVMFIDELELEVEETGATGVLDDDEVVKLITGPFEVEEDDEDEDVMRMTVVTGVVLIVVFMLWLQLDIT